MLPVVYPIRVGDRNEELRYSLRSLSNLSHGDVWLVGHRPGWVRNVRYLPTKQGRSKYRNAMLALRAVAARLDEPFLWISDDVYFLEEWVPVPWHRGRLSKLKKGSSGWHRSIRGSAALLGDPDPLVYDCHQPMVFDPLLLGETLELAGDAFVAPKTLYGNQHRVGGENLGECKTWTGKGSGPVVSTSNSSFPKWQPRLEGLFPERSEFE